MSEESRTITIEKLVEDLNRLKQHMLIFNVKTGEYMNLKSWIVNSGMAQAFVGDPVRKVDFQDLKLEEALPKGEGEGKE